MARVASLAALARAERSIGLSVEGSVSPALSPGATSSKKGMHRARSRHSSEGADVKERLIIGPAHIALEIRREFGTPKSLQGSTVESSAR